MTLALTFTGDVSELTLSEHDTLFLRADDRPAAVVPIIYQGDASVFTVQLDTDSWGTDYTVTRHRPASGAAAESVDGKLLAFRESARAQALDAARRAKKARRDARDAQAPNYWLRYPWR